MTHPTSTRAQVIEAFGGPERLHAAELPLTAPGPHQVQVAVAAAAVNPVDLTTRTGLNIPEADARFPLVLGWDLAGTITRIGSDVDPAGGWAVGDRVAAMTFQPVDQNGTYTEHLNLAAELLVRVPEDLPIQQAATIPLAGLTAAQLVAALDLPAGARVLVDAPLGAVGRLAVQLAARAGLRVTAVVKPADAEQARTLGADDVVARGDFAEQVRPGALAGLDGAIDLVGGSAAHQAFASVRDGGRYATAVPAYIDPTGTFETVRGITPHVHTVSPDAALLAQLMTAAARGDLTSAVEAAYPLEQAGEAHRRQQAGSLRGKLVLVP